MIPPEIDLTENRDFRGESEFTWISGHFPTGMLYWELMSRDQFELVHRYESIFGRKSHHSERYQVFSKDDKTFAEECRWHCERCGVSIRLPWKNINGVCPKCHDILEGRIPWKEKYAQIRNREENIFDLR